MNPIETPKKEIPYAALKWFLPFRTKVTNYERPFPKKDPVRDQFIRRLKVTDHEPDIIF